VEIGAITAVSAAVVALLLGQLAFRAQRVSLNLSRTFCSRFGLPRSAQSGLHRIFTPKWAAPLDLAGKLMVLAVMGWLAYAHWWVWSLCYLLCSWVIGFSLDFVNPWPSVDDCLSWSRARLESSEFAMMSPDAQKTISAAEWQQVIQAAQDHLDNWDSHAERDCLRRL